MTIAPLRRRFEMSTVDSSPGPLGAIPHDVRCVPLFTERSDRTEQLFQLPYEWTA
jgi:hypothetical protein